MEYREITASTVDDAITKACIELGISSDNLDYQVVSEGSRGFLGLGSKPAVIKVRKKEPVAKQQEKAVQAETKPVVKKEAPKRVMPKAEPVKETVKEPVKRAEVRSEVKASPAKAEKNEFVQRPERVVTPKTEAEIQTMTKTAEEFLGSVFKSMNMEVQITMEYNQNDGSLNVDFAGEEMGILIGKRGQTLDSLQYLTSLVVNKGNNEYVRVKLDTENYRRRRKDTLENLARNIAFKVKKTRKAVSLEPMNPYERRIIHSALQSNKFVETFSEGEEPFRHVVVDLKR